MSYSCSLWSHLLSDTVQVNQFNIKIAKLHFNLCKCVSDSRTLAGIHCTVNEFKA